MHAGECWLKYQERWDGDPGTLEVSSRGEYSSAYREEHRTAPEMVPWTAGALPGRAAGNAR